MVSEKRCPKCGEIKPASEFHKNASRYDGLQSLCKSCQRETNRRYQHSDKGRRMLRAAMRKYARSEKGRLAKQRQRQTEHYNAKRAQYRKSVQYRAHCAVSSAVQTGRLPLVASQQCRWPACEKPAEVYHHESYKRARWLDVIPLCHIHHHALHREYTSFEEVLSLERLE